MTEPRIYNCAFNNAQYAQPCDRCPDQLARAEAAEAERDRLRAQLDEGRLRTQDVDDHIIADLIAERDRLAGRVADLEAEVTDLSAEWESAESQRKQANERLQQAMEALRELMAACDKALAVDFNHSADATVYAEARHQALAALAGEDDGPA